MVRWTIVIIPTKLSSAFLSLNLMGISVATFRDFLAIFHDGNQTSLSEHALLLDSGNRLLVSPLLLGNRAFAFEFKNKDCR